MGDAGDGFWRPDVRVAFVCDDGAAVSLHYRGLVEQTDAFATSAAEDRETAWEDQYIRMSLWFETGDARYLWLTRSLFDRARPAARHGPRRVRGPSRDLTARCDHACRVM